MKKPPRKVTAKEAIAFTLYTRAKRAQQFREWYARNHEKALERARVYRERKKAELSPV